jgi:hypothetical protein
MLKMTIVLVSGIALLVSGCTEKYQAVEQRMESLIDCATLVSGVVKGTHGTKRKVASGDYNKMIDQRIREIKARCGI